MYDIPGWFDPASPKPAPADVAAQEQNQYLWLSQVDFPFAFDFRAELEARAGGNPSWNTGVDYAHQLQISIDNAEVRALYAAAGLNLGADLHTLAAARRIQPDPSAVAYLVRNIIFDGQVHIPELSLHTIGDGLVPVENEQAYASVVASQGNGQYLRQAYINRAGHCAFTSAELIAGFSTLVQRLDTGAWGASTSPSRLEAVASALGPSYNGVISEPTVRRAPAFVAYTPLPFPRPYDIRQLTAGGAETLPVG